MLMLFFWWYQCHLWIVISRIFCVPKPTLIRACHWSSNLASVRLNLHIGKMKDPFWMNLVWKVLMVEKTPSQHTWEINQVETQTKKHLIRSIQKYFVNYSLYSRELRLSNFQKHEKMIKGHLKHKSFTVSFHIFTAAGDTLQKGEKNNL